MILSLKRSWSSAHFYKVEQWSREKNKEKFGPCGNEDGHGHDYQIELSFQLPEKPPQMQGQLESLIDQVVDQLLRKLDHHHLNLSTDHFKNRVPTTENLAQFWFEEISNSLPKVLPEPVNLLGVKLYEKPDLWVELKADLPL